MFKFAYISETVYGNSNVYYTKAMHALKIYLQLKQLYFLVPRSPRVG